MGIFNIFLVENDRAYNSLIETTRIFFFPFRSTSNAIYFATTENVKKLIPSIVSEILVVVQRHHLKRFIRTAFLRYFFFFFLCTNSVLLVIECCQWEYGSIIKTSLFGNDLVYACVIGLDHCVCILRKLKKKRSNSL